MIRAGYGAGEIDALFRIRAQKQNDSGALAEVYWLSYADTVEMAEREAVLFIETIEEFKLRFPLTVAFTLDTVRYASSRGVSLDAQSAKCLAEAFCRKMKTAGYDTIYVIALDQYEKDIFKES